MPHQQALIDFTLQLADSALILGHRNSEWTGHGPILGQDIGLAKIALDLIGQARYLCQYAAQLMNTMTTSKDQAVTEDVLAYLRDSWDFKNCLLVEQGNGDWGKTVLRQFFFSTYPYFFFRELQKSRDVELSAIAEKSLKEVTYHLRWSSEWVIRLGDGTEESHSRLEKALDELWMYTGELFQPADYEQSLMPSGIVVDLADIKPLWTVRVTEVLREAALAMPGPAMQAGGKQVKHTEQLGYLLAEMQFIQRAYPGCEW